MSLNNQKSYSIRLQFLTQLRMMLKYQNLTLILLNQTAESYSTENEYTSYLIFSAKEALWEPQKSKMITLLSQKK